MLSEFEVGFAALLQEIIVKRLGRIDLLLKYSELECVHILFRGLVFGLFQRPLGMPNGLEPRLTWLHHVPNGGPRSKAAAGKLKAMGVVAGVPDIFLPVAAREFHGLYIELKAPGATLSPAQGACIAALANQGYNVGIYIGWLAAARHLCWYLDRDDLARQLGGTP